MTSIHTAVTQGNQSLISKLVSEGKDINELDPRGDTPLLVCLKAKNEELAEFLITLGADTTIGNGQWTPEKIAHAYGLGAIASSIGEINKRKMLVRKHSQTQFIANVSEGSSPRSTTRAQEMVENRQQLRRALSRKSSQGSLLQPDPAPASALSAKTSSPNYFHFGTSEPLHSPTLLNPASTPRSQHSGSPRTQQGGGSPRGSRLDEPVHKFIPNKIAPPAHYLTPAQPTPVLEAPKPASYLDCALPGCAFM